MAREKASRPALPDLPIVGCMGELRAALARGHAVLSAEPGSGKTTLAPLLLLDEPWLSGGKIIILEPRRPAARMAATRMAALYGEEVGATIGYQVRFERKISAVTRIEVLTEGLLLRRLQADPELSGVGLLIFDEFHERNLQTDLSLALALDVAAGLRNDLRLLVMSATLDAGPLCRMLPATEVSVAGRAHPVQVHYADRDPDPRDPTSACLRALGSVLEQARRDVLVFLPGRREIERLRHEVTARWGDRLDAMALYGDLPAAEQDRVLQGAGERRRVIIATDIAETSLTIEGVDAVVDSGLARKPVFDPNTGLTRLETQWISKAAALQRAGRAGRLGPGLCYRAWTGQRHARLLDWTPPEILGADLAGLVLELANWGVTEAQALHWLDAPPPPHWQQAATLLGQLGALGPDGCITAVGRHMARFPAHPRLAHVLATAVQRADQRLAADVAALLSERDPLRRAADGGCSADISLRLDALAAQRDNASLPAGFDPAGLRRIARTSSQFLRLCTDTRDHAAAAIEVADCIALAYPDRVAQCTSTDGRRYRLRSGRAALLDQNDPLRGSPFLAVAGIDAGRREGAIRLAAPLTRDAVEALFATQIRSDRELYWDSGRRDIAARRLRRLDALVLEESAVGLSADDPVIELLLEQIRRDGLAAFFDDPLTLRARVQTARALEPGGDWPDFSEPALLADLESWLSPWLHCGEGARQLRRLRLQEVLLGVLGRDRGRRLEEQLPTHFETPAGTRRQVQYALDGPAVLAVPLQEMLGVRETPRLAGGRLALVLHLLSPAGRPLQVTSDLSAFWAGAYTEVKKEMRGRYPKHVWPDDPATATATRFSKRRR